MLKNHLTTLKMLTIIPLGNNFAWSQNFYTFSARPALIEKCIKTAASSWMFPLLNKKSSARRMMLYTITVCELVYRATSICFSACHFLVQYFLLNLIWPQYVHVLFSRFRRTQFAGIGFLKHWTTYFLPKKVSEILLLERQALSCQLTLISC